MRKMRPGALLSEAIPRNQCAASLSIDWGRSQPMLRCLAYLAILLLAIPAHAQVAFKGAAQASVASTAGGSITHVGVGAVASSDTACPRAVTPAIPAGNAGDLLI